ncbi:MAG TPA: AzlD domain-containing protein, partial [Chloroflexia bacterium]|nr:AzlD domain-containing protein [Chloroflexia bacterium]
MNEAIIIVGMALITFGIRYPALALLGRINLPPGLLRALYYVPPVVLTAIIVPAVLFKRDQLALTPTNDYLVAGLLAVVVAWRSKNLLLTIVVGMAALLAWRALLAAWG